MGTDTRENKQDVERTEPFRVTAGKGQTKKEALRKRTERKRKLAQE